MKSIQPWVFFSSIALITVFVTLTILNQNTVGELFGNVQAFISEKFGWLYVGSVNIILVFVVYLGFSRFRNIRIGGERCEPEFGG